MATKTYAALTPIEHDGKRVEEGGRIALTEEQAAPLLALKAVGPARAARVRSTGAADGAGEGSSAGDAGEGSSAGDAGEEDPAESGDAVPPGTDPAP